MRLFPMCTAADGPAGPLPATAAAPAPTRPAQALDCRIRAGGARFDVGRSAGRAFVLFGVRPGRAASRRSRAVVRAGRRQPAARAARTRGEQP